MSNFKQTLEEYLKINKDLREIIFKSMGFKFIDWESPIEYEPDTKFSIDIANCELVFYDKDNEAYYYNTSSIGMKCEEIYLTEIDDKVVIMAYPEDGSWSNTTIFILNKENQIK